MLTNKKAWKKSAMVNKRYDKWKRRKNSVFCVCVSTDTKQNEDGKSILWTVQWLKTKHKKIDTGLCQYII